MHRGYTINYFIKEVKKLPRNLETRTKCFEELLSPRTPWNSQKLTALKQFMDWELYAVLRGDYGFENFGKTPRTRLLKALKNRKKNGYLSTY